MSMINKQEKFINKNVFQHFNFYEQLKFYAQLKHHKSFITNGQDKQVDLHVGGSTYIRGHEWGYLK